MNDGQKKGTVDMILEKAKGLAHTLPSNLLSFTRSRIREITESKMDVQRICKSVGLKSFLFVLSSKTK